MNKIQKLEEKQVKKAGISRSDLSRQEKIEKLEEAMVSEN